MAQKITLSLKESNVKFAKKKASSSNTSVSKIFDEYLDLLQKIDVVYKKNKLTPFAKRFSGIVNTGKNEDLKNIF